MSWLARMEIDVSTARAEGISDSYAWHKRMWEMYPDMPGAKRDFLTRIDQLEKSFRLWVLTQRKPTRPQWCPPDSFALKEIAASFLSHRYYIFDLRANPTKSIVQRDINGDRRRQGKRIPLVKYDELLAWLERKGTVRCRDKNTGLNVPGGFRLVKEKPLEIGPMVENHFRKNGHSGYHGGVQFRGTLEVTDPARFVETYYFGIGGAKSFGFGLLLLAPVNL